MRTSKMLVALLALLIVGLYSCQKNEPVSVEQETAGIVKYSQDVIPGQYIVVYNSNDRVLKSAPAGHEAMAAAVVQLTDRVFALANVSAREPEYVYTSAIKGLAVEMTEAEALRVSKVEGVREVVQDVMIIMARPGTDATVTQPPQTIPVGITRVGGAVAYTGTNRAWIIDTGVDYDHPDLKVNTTLAKFFTRSKSADDDNGHGTHCAGIVAAIDNTIGVVGVAAGAEVVPVKVLDRRGSGAMSGILAGVDYVAQTAKPGDAANMSLGGGIYTLLDEAVVNLGKLGVFVAIAAGNETQDANNVSPARANGLNVYTISAVDSKDVFAYFSNFSNPPVDYAAPGVSIYSTYMGGGYATMSGTSMAAPHVCGLLLSTGGVLRADGYAVNDPDGTPDPIAHR